MSFASKQKARFDKMSRAQLQAEQRKFNPGASGNIKRIMAKKALAALDAREGAESKFKSLVEGSGQLAGSTEGGITDPLAAIRKQGAEAETLLGQARAGSTKKKDVENLLKATGMREAELRAKKAAPGFSRSKSLVG